MVKYFTNAFPHTQWASAYEFIKDAFSLTSDTNFEEQIKIIKIEENGYILDFCVDGDLLCYVKITTSTGLLRLRHWQGIKDYKDITLSQFVETLRKELVSASKNKYGSKQAG